MNAVERIEDLAGLLAIPGVVEELELRSTLGAVSYTHLTLPTKA